MRRLVLDTNARRAEIFIGAACEAELERVLAYDLGKRSLDAVGQAFLEAALAARADFLVTKDRALLELARRSRSLPFRIIESFK